MGNRSAIVEKEQAGSLSKDKRLAFRVATGEPDAGRELAERLYNRIRATMSYMIPGADAEDMAQNALIQILRSTDSYRGESALEYWADRIAIRCALKALEKKNRRRHLADMNWSPPMSIQTTEEAAERLRARYRLSVLLQSLTPQQRIALVLHYVHGYTVEEIAQSTDAVVNTVRGRLRSARAKLKQKILSDALLKEWVARGEYNDSKD